MSTVLALGKESASHEKNIQVVRHHCTRFLLKINEIGDDPLVHLMEMLNCLNFDQFDFNDIDLSENELRRIARECLEREIKRPYWYNVSPERIYQFRYCLTKLDLVLADIKTTEDELETRLRGYHKLMATGLLGSVRPPRWAEPGIIEKIRDHLKQGNWTLSDISTNEDELKKKEELYHKYKAKNLIKVSPDRTKEILDHLKQGNWTLSDLNMSEDSLMAVRRMYHKREALNWLKSARISPTRYGHRVTSVCIEKVRGHLMQGGLTLSDVETNENELEMMQRMYYKRAAARLLNSVYVARTEEIRTARIEEIRKHLTQGNWTFADIGANEDDLSKLGFWRYWYK